MNFSIIFVGNTENNGTNKDFLRTEADTLGVTFFGSANCSSEAELRSALASALDSSSIIFIVGGVGTDDSCFTIRTVSHALGFPTALNENCMNIMRDKIRSTGGNFHSGYSAAAVLPTNCTVLPNDAAVAPGCALTSSNQYIAMLPSSPRELEVMFQRYCYKALLRFTGADVAVKYAGCFAPSAEQLSELENRCSELGVKYVLRPSGDDVSIKVVAEGDSLYTPYDKAESAMHAVRKVFGEKIYSDNDLGIAVATAERLSSAGSTFSCAQFAVSDPVADIFPKNSTLAYTFNAEGDSSKLKRVVPKNILNKYGAVSETAAVCAAVNARKEGGSSIGLSLINCTDGSSVYAFAAVCDSQRVWTKRLPAGKDLSVLHAIDLVRLYLDGYLKEDSGAVIAAALAGESALLASSFTSDELPAPDSKKSRSFLAGFIPWKGDAPTEIIRKIVFLVALVVFIGSGTYIANYFIKSANNRNLVNGLASLYNPEFSQSDTSSPQGSGGSDFPESSPESAFPPSRFKDLYEINSDIVGMLMIPGTPLNHVVVQAYDNDYYLRRDFYRKTSEYGVLFADYEVDFEKESTNTIIYGHNMRDEQMFGEIIKYKKISYYREHPVIYFDSIYSDGMTAYKIVACFLANTLDTDGPVFNYHMFIDGSEKATQDYLAEAISRSYICTGVDVLPTDKLLTLSTCSYEFYEARWVVVARKVRPGEDASVDTSVAYKNPSPVMPDTWIKAYQNSYASEISEGALAPSSSSSSSSSAPESSFSSEEENSKVSRPQTSRPNTSRPSWTSRPSESSRPGYDSEPSSDWPWGEFPWLDPNSSDSSVPDESPSSSPEEPNSSSSSAPESSASEPDIDSSSSLPESSAESSEESSNESSEESSLPESSSEESSSSPEDEKEALFEQLANEVVIINGDTMTAFDAICQIVNAEVGDVFHPEAIKAQAVASYTFLKYNNNELSGVLRRNPVSDELKEIVKEVFGLTVKDDKSHKYVLATYTSSNAGVSVSAESAWGGAVRNLLSVESLDDFEYEFTLPADEVREIVLNSSVFSELDLTLEDGNEKNWFRPVTYLDGNEGYYIETMYVGEELISGAKFRNKVMLSESGSRLLHSTAFTATYDEATDSFTFVSRGWGHGVGLSQRGANLYAKEGKTFDWILLHYYSNSYIHNPFEE